MKTSDFDYDLPPDRIAQHPSPRRENARLLVLDRRSGKIDHKSFPDLFGYLRAGDLLVLNDARVIPARLLGEKLPTGGKVEVLLLREEEAGSWRALVRPARRIRPGTEIDFGGRIRAVIAGRIEKEGVRIQFSGGEDLLQVVDEIGYPPLPPYIKRELKRYPRMLQERDRKRYQTVFARKPGAIAAPTAGFHFTEKLLKSIREEGVGIAFITLYVGYGTFQPVKTENLEDHRMHAEYYEIGQLASDQINELRKTNGSLWVVGTTAVRALESAAGADGRVKPASAWTDIFIYPGYNFKLDFKLITNFHFPRSTLLMLVSALAGQDKIMKAYARAIARGYRFYSFGDAMAII